jgi:hypothetical protein
MARKAREETRRKVERVSKSDGEEDERHRPPCGRLSSPRGVRRHLQEFARLMSLSRHQALNYFFDMKRNAQEKAKGGRASNFNVAATIAGVAAVGCEDDPSEGREGPTHPHGRAEFRRELECMREWLTRDWLCAPDRHPVRDVWRRHDAGASLELQSIATSISKILPKARAAPGGQALLREWRKRVTGSDPVLMRGALFEVYMAGLFDTPRHGVRTVSDRQPGYDFGVEFNNGALLRVSCKSRGESNEERVASKFAAALRDLIREQTGPGAAVDVQVFAPLKAHESLFNADAVLPRVRAAIRAARLGQAAPDSPPNDWRINACRSTCPQEGLVYRTEDRLSFRLLVAVPLDGALIANRFRQTVGNAIANVEQHCDVGTDRANVIVFRIPQNLALDDARRAVVEALGSTTSTRTSSVFLYRVQLSTGHPREPHYLGHELVEVENASAVSAASIIPGGTLALKIHGGKVQNVEPTQFVTDGKQSFPIGPDMWLRLHGQHHYRRPDWRGGDVSMHRLYGVAQWFSHGHFVSGGIAEKPMSAAVQDTILLL